MRRVCLVLAGSTFDDSNGSDEAQQRKQQFYLVSPSGVWDLGTAHTSTHTHTKGRGMVTKASVKRNGYTGGGYGTKTTARCYGVCVIFYHRDMRRSKQG